MNPRSILTAVGAGVATALLVAVLVIELLDVEFSAIVGLPAGALAGIGVLVALASTVDDRSQRVQRVASAYAAFGLAVLVQLALGYANVGRSRGLFSVEVVVGVGVAVAVGVYAALWVRERNAAAEGEPASSLGR